jgi:alpha-L-fucosidase 2
VTPVAERGREPREHSLWFDRAAVEWTEALPLGNGRIGAMIFGEPACELIQLNDGTAWSGSPASAQEPPLIDTRTTIAAIARARSAIDAQDYGAADDALRRVQHRHSQTFLPFADVRIRSSEADAIADYRRELDLDTATHTVTFEVPHGTVTRETFISARANVLVHTVTTTVAAGLDLNVELSTQLRMLGAESSDDRAALTMSLPADVYPPHDDPERAVTYQQGDGSSLQAAVVAGWVHDGRRLPAPAGGLAATGVMTATIVVTTETTFAGIGEQPVGTADDALAQARRRVDAALAEQPGALGARHRDDHSELYGRVEFSITAPDRRSEPVDRRLRIANTDPRGALAADPSLAALLFHYGRYLLISCSRDGGVPANLQGIWNSVLRPPWSSNYTTNINLQMNYWMAESANLVDCLPPLFDFIDALTRSGAETAARVYGLPGWVAHHNSDVWSYSLPVGEGAHEPKWSFWPMAGAWLIRHLWERVLHGAGDEFARERAWEPIRSAAEFGLGWLVEQSDGTLGTSPSTSPENEFIGPDGRVGQAGRSSALDLVLLADLFDMVDSLATRLGLDDDRVARAVREARPRLDVPRIGSAGLVQEWKDDLAPVEPHHRHLSHLYFAYPGSWPLGGDWARAVSDSLDQRGDESTGWSLAWKMLIRARLHQPDRVNELLRLVFRDLEVERGPFVGGLYTNLLSAHPPFQIDGNLGYAAAVAECLVQSHLGSIDLLPAVPPSFVPGSVRGLRVRPGIEVDIQWSAGEDGVAELTGVSLRAVSDEAVTKHLLRYDGRETTVALELGVSTVLTRDDFSIPEPTPDPIGRLG